MNRIDSLAINSLQGIHCITLTRELISVILITNSCSEQVLVKWLIWRNLKLQLFLEVLESVNMLRLLILTIL